MSAEPVTPPEASGANMLRQPMTGMSNIQHMLYWQNRPDVMANTQKWQTTKMRSILGASPEDPAWREVPKQRSPFKQ